MLVSLQFVYKCRGIKYPLTENFIDKFLPNTIIFSLNLVLSLLPYFSPIFIDARMNIDNKDANLIFESFSFIVAVIIYQSRPAPIHSVAVSISAFVASMFACSFGVQVFHSVDTYDDLYLRWLFGGVLLCGLLYDQKLDVQNLFFLCGPIIEILSKYKSLSNRPDSPEFQLCQEKLKVIFALFCVGFFVAFTHCGLEVLIADSFLGSSACTVFFLLLKWEQSFREHQQNKNDLIDFIQKSRKLK